MPRRLRVTAESLAKLRDFLADAQVDMGCRPVAVKRAGQYATTVISDEMESDRLMARRFGGVEIELLDDLPSVASRLRMVSRQNRFRHGDLPRGLGVKTKP